MSGERAWSLLRTAVGLAVVVALVWLVVASYRPVAWSNTGLMLVGLGGLLAMLWSYNRGRR